MASEEEIEELYNFLDTGLSRYKKGDAEFDALFDEANAMLQALTSEDTSEAAATGVPGQGNAPPPAPETAQQPRTRGPQGSGGGTTSGEKVLGALDAAQFMARSAAAEPLAGVAGGVTALFGGADRGADTVASVRDRLTGGGPMTQQGAENLQSIGRGLNNALTAIGLNDAGSRMGDVVFESTGNAFLSALAETAPTAVMELLPAGAALHTMRRVSGNSAEAAKLAKAIPASKLGRKSLDREFSAQAEKELMQGLPSLDSVSRAKKAAYDAVDESAVGLSYDSVANLKSSFNSRIKKSQYDVLINKQMPETRSVRDLIDGYLEQGSEMTIKQLDDVRSVILAKMGDAKAKDLDGLNLALDVVDDYLKPENVVSHMKGADEATRTSTLAALTQARDLAGREARAKIVENIMDRAGTEMLSGGDVRGSVISGLKDLRTKATGNTGVGRYFKPHEVKAIEDVLTGDIRNPGQVRKSVNRTLDFIGSAHLSPNSSAAAVLRSGVAANLAYIAGHAMTGSVAGGLAFGAGASMGTTALMRRTSLNAIKDARAVRDIIAAGPNARKIAEAYVRHRPKGSRNADELANLLLHENMDFSDFPGDAFVQEAARRSLHRMAGLAILAGTVPGTVLPEGESPPQQQGGEVQPPMQQPAMQQRGPVTVNELPSAENMRQNILSGGQ